MTATLADRALAHLMRHPVGPDATDVPRDVTQDGIADALGAQVAHVSRALKTLELRGLVRAHLAHPVGARRRSRAYLLTDEGRARAQMLKDLTPAPERPRPPPSPPASAPAGRSAQLAALLDALAEASRNGPRIALVEGDAGTGKTRLLAAFAAQAGARKVRVLQGRASPTGDEQLLGPLAGALEPLAFDRRVRARAAGTPRERALGAATEAIESAARAETVAVVLDDLHLSGASAIDFLHGLVRALPAGTRALFVLAFRREEAWDLPNGPLYTALTPLRDAPGARHVELGPLDEAGIEALLVDAGAEHVPKDLITRVARESGGNPLYALAMAEAMLDGVDEEDFFPAQVRALATQRFAGLRAEELSALQGAAVCGVEFSYDDLLRVTEADEDALVPVLDVLLDRLLLEEVPAEELRLRFAHPKIRDAVLHQITAPRRRLLESRLIAKG